MKRFLSLALTTAIIVCAIPFGAFNFTVSAATSGYYTYRVTQGTAVITGVSSSIGGDITIPSNLDGYKVTSIGYSAFKNCLGITSITIPDSVKSIVDYAFYNCDNIKTVTIGKGVTSVGDSAFESCDKLTTVNYNATNCTKMYTYYYHSLSYYYSVFKDSPITTVNIGSNVVSMPQYAFESCYKLTTVNYNATNCETMGSYNSPVFSGSSITTLNIGENVKTIPDYAFKDCKFLKNVTIPSSVTSIGKGAFLSCSGLKNVYYKGSKTNKAKISISGENSYLTKSAWYYDSCIGSKSHKYKTTTTKATLSKNGKVVKKCTVCDKKTNSTIKYAKTFKLSTTSYTYNGKVKTPIVTVKDSAGNKLKKNVDYTLTSSNGRKNVGTYKVTIKGKGNYTGTKTLTFKINPVGTKVSKLTAGKKSIAVNISKKSTQVSGYQIQYSTSKKFTGAKTKVVNYKTTKTILKSLSAKKTYYVRVRTYKTVSGKKYYSPWSSYKHVKTK